MTSAIVFGGTGALGAAIVAALHDEGWDVDVAARTARDAATVDISDPEWAHRLSHRYSAVVWSQGSNLTADVTNTDSAQMHDLFDANVVFISETLRELLAAGAIEKPCRSVVISSIWQIAARADKLAYVASKAALAGLVPALAADLADKEFAINAVLPGVIDTPMTRANLSLEQLSHVRSETLGGALARPEDVANAVAWLVDSRANGINGQWIAVDNGWSAVRSV